MCGEYDFIPFELKNIKANQSRKQSNDALYNSIFEIINEKYGFSESMHIISTVEEGESLEQSAALQDADSGVIEDLMRDDSLLYNTPPAPYVLSKNELLNSEGQVPSDMQGHTPSNMQGQVPSDMPSNYA